MQLSNGLSFNLIGKWEKNVLAHHINPNDPRQNPPNRRVYRLEKSAILMT